MRLKLEDKLIGRLTEGDYYDTVVPRLALRVREKGTRRYVIRYRKDTQTRRFTLGDARVLTLAQARKRARIELGKVDAGGDPQEEKVVARRERGTSTVEAVAESFLAAQKNRWRPKTRYEFERLMRREVLPELGKTHPRDVTRKDVKRWLEEMAQDRPATANRVLEVLRLLYSWAVEEELLEGSPVVSIKRWDEAARERTYSDAELHRILAAAPGTSYAGVVPLVLWTGVRSHEARSARWEHLDLRRRLWTIPTKYAKHSRRKKPEPLRVPLSDAAVSLLEAVGVQDIGWVFPAPVKACETCGEPGHAPKGTYAVNAIRRRSGVQDFRMHDLRRTVGQRIADQFGDGRMHLVLNHARGKLAETYAPMPALTLAREALEWWGAELGRIEARA